MNRSYRGLLLLAALVSSAAQAIIVLPGGRVGRANAEAPGVLDLFTDSPTLLASRSEAVNGLSGTVFGTLTSAVLRNDAGTLDFYYQYENGVGSDPIHRITMNPFTNWTTDVGYRTDGYGPFVAGTIIPNEANRNISGSVVGFDFDAPTAIPSGATSVTLVVRTNARQFDSGFASVINGSATTVLAYRPVPEPATLATLGLGALALLRKRRQR